MTASKPPEFQLKRAVRPVLDVVGREREPVSDRAERMAEYEDVCEREL
ncbi:hypothetical protein [Stakelama saccharophila]|uniref:Uncharacterized protein n=1 Tax=Stakelama saccharophila TaxID=3075605 RepID=A0ABZ0BB04_9SPHN|nr:hypothetical protein [Stakelama sp. W311]WNO54256.1 hypothetical protein RPR59_03050 [Stakelama sp. W311]